MRKYITLFLLSLLVVINATAETKAAKPRPEVKTPPVTTETQTIWDLEELYKVPKSFPCPDILKNQQSDKVKGIQLEGRKYVLTSAQTVVNWWLRCHREQFESLVSHKQSFLSSFQIILILRKERCLRRRVAIRATKSAGTVSPQVLEVPPEAAQRRICRNG